MTNEEPTSVGEDMPRQQERVRRCLQRAHEMARLPGVNMAFYVAMASKLLREADDALASADPVRIVRAYAQLKSFEE